MKTKYTALFTLVLLFLSVLVKGQESGSTSSENGKRAQNVFDWKFIVPHYEALWTELAQIRSSYQQSNASAIRKPKSYTQSAQHNNTNVPHKPCIENL